MTDERTTELETKLNEIISEAVQNGGHVYVVDKKRNTFALKLTEPVTVHFFGGYRRTDNEKETNE